MLVGAAATPGKTVVRGYFTFGVEPKTCRNSQTSEYVLMPATGPARNQGLADAPCI